MTAGAEKGKAGSARRSPDLVPKDPGSIPGTSTIAAQTCDDADRRTGMTDSTGSSTRATFVAYSPFRAGCYRSAG